MARPRVHDLDRLLDAAERLVVEAGAQGVTVRSLATAAGVSNGSIYHAFGSLGALLAHVWLRAAGEFLDLQTELADQTEDPAAAVVAAASAPAVFADRRPEAARLLITVKKEHLLGPQVPDDLAGDLLALDKRLIALLVRLAGRLWDRRDAQAVEVLTTCVVDLPTAVFLRAFTAGEPISEDSRTRLASAVRAILLLPPPRKD
ncbi:TetR/AcrR family transcriptional regulator [Amycolatopsis roodepoortensis]|uniref:AcrR family transcriptional regulator n=1 Tax=Amycolatopsis roodepoortensis TaxID=700274 RepID=A0ABR9L495_9PSEU|nr:TetR/AcrR family transcriptional regulator [Amycolatopsis roodepoortensis]MBE1575564.1 AcrR family transcriptional regulator [Amycolatopsis roodepoortensis]